MSQRFVRCNQCGLPHDASIVTCPITKRPIDKAEAPQPPSRRTVGQMPVDGGAAPPSAAPPRTRELAGRIVGEKYRIRAVLGEGGMGTVYEAEHLGLRRAVAIKVLHPGEVRKKEAIKRFHQEARAASSIGHPNICEVYDFGTLPDGSPYLVMEKLMGETLADRIHEHGGLPFDEAVDVLVQVLSGLHAAHEKGVMHRDIKPENVFLTRRVGCLPVAKVLDFGVSKMMPSYVTGDRDEDLDLTRTGMVMGTPYYMAPEQARGERALDARVDLWACGVMLYEALTGRRPFVASNYNALLLQILTNDPRPARQLRTDLPAAFDVILSRALARSRDERYSNAVAFIDDLRAFQAGQPLAGAVVVRKDLGETAARTPAARARRAEGAREDKSGSGSGPRSSRGSGGASASPSSRGSGGRARLPSVTEFSDAPPSSLEIPVTFVPEAPSAELIPVIEASRVEAPPKEPSPFEDAQLADAEPTERRSGDLEALAAEEEPRDTLVRDTVVKRPTFDLDFPADDPPAKSPPRGAAVRGPAGTRRPRFRIQRRSDAPPAPSVRPATPRSGGIAQGPPAPASSRARPVEDRRAADGSGEEEGTADDGRTQIYRGPLPSWARVPIDEPPPARRSGMRVDDTAQTDDGFEAELERAKQRIEADEAEARLRREGGRKPKS